MSSRSRLLCSLPIIAAALCALVPAHFASAGSEPIVGKTGAEELVTFSIEGAADESAWTTMTLDEPRITLDHGSRVDAFNSLSDNSSQRSSEQPIIAAPLPPAVLSGFIGLAGVYAYKRRRRFR